MLADIVFSDEQQNELNKMGNEEFVVIDENDVFSTEELEYMDFLNNIIKRMVCKRVYMRITQKELANMVGISKVSISRIETRASEPSLETLYKIGKCLGMKLEDFTTDFFI
jgi:DNA-binding XRE family transcriptional regulator